jgi:endonuclease/exonuclease/phosphatase family metal-dependent hydrolase
MKIASFNVENLFNRAAAMNEDDWEDGKVILAEFAKVTALLQKEEYTDDVKADILASLTKLGLKKSDEAKYAILRQNRGKLIKRPKTGPPEIVAEGRGSWIGWVDLKREAVDVTATRMTARVIQDVNADVLAVVEAEDRIALKRFNDQLLEPASAGYNCIMLIDGNDERGIDVGLMTKRGFDIGTIVSHVDDFAGGSRLFSRDCPEFTVTDAAGNAILVIVNHLKSKGYGPPAASNARRKAQATRVREIYDKRRAEGIDLIAIVGDMNDTPDSDPMSPLLKAGSDLKDVSQHPAFVSDGRPGTFATGTKSNKIDYILLSPALFAKVTAAGVFRKGVWGGKNGTIFPHYDEMTKEFHAASDHAAIWADISL